MASRHPPSRLVHAMLDTIEHDIVPLTEAGVKNGSKVFGAALLRKDDLSLVLAETNNEAENPMWHGETHVIKRFFEMDKKDRPAVDELIFLSTHEPCSMCLSAITWCGFDNFYYYFSYEQTRDAFAIPADLRILKEVFTLDSGAYNRENMYWTSRGIMPLIEALDPSDRASAEQQCARIDRLYDGISEIYEQRKDGNDISHR